MKLGVGALLATLFLFSCTGAESNPEPQLRAQKPVKKIDTEFVLESHWAMRGHSAMIYHPLPKVYPRRTNALVARLQEQQPPWLRYIKAVELSSFWSRMITVRTGIFVNGPGKEVGRTICYSLLDSGTSVTVLGLPRPETLPRALLASCRHPILRKLPSR